MAPGHCRCHPVVTGCPALCRYRTVLGKARKWELARHHVILCTCSCAAAPSLRTLDVWQVLVDEAGMATEPETLIPLVNFPRAEKVGGGLCLVDCALRAGCGHDLTWDPDPAAASQVVLLGDHKQLRPVVKNEQLQNLGLDRSLFERYHRDAFMLDTQYRMVSSPAQCPPSPDCLRAQVGSSVPAWPTSLPCSTQTSAPSHPWNSTRSS